MPLKKGDILDEYKRYPDSCGLLLKVMAGGEGLEKIVCCGHDLTAEDVVSEKVKKGNRKPGPKGVGIIIDERKSYPHSCGLRLMIMDGGQGLQRVECCGHPLTLADEREFMDLGMRNCRSVNREDEESGGPVANA
jgi:hypothetical protein